MPKLMIIESPGKLAKLRVLLGAGWNVHASMGHVRDLPDGRIGAEPPDFVPEFEVTARGRKVLGDLAKAAWEADVVYIATDPDREGEALAWHLKECLSINDKYFRVSFNEITEKAVKEALANPRKIDMALVRSQEARRVIDKLVGYKLSPAVSHLKCDQLSVGRVQTPVVRLLCAREIERIRDVKEPQHRVVFRFGDWFALWDRSAEDARQIDLVERVAAAKIATVSSCETRLLEVPPPPPFNTSSMLQVAFRRLGMSCVDTMKLAQKLYERGAITYHRTDNPNITPESLSQIAAVLDRKAIPCVAMPRVFPLPPGAQAAHPAITPTRWEVISEGIGEKAQSLYRLIRIRGLLSQVESAQCRVRVARLTVDLGGTIVPLVAVRRKWMREGWRVVLNDEAKEDHDPSFRNQVPKLDPGQVLKVIGTMVKALTPPPRYDQAELVARMEQEGIGRPSTYAATIQRIQDRGLAISSTEDDQVFLCPTKAGLSVLTTLIGVSKFAEITYTREMEAALDAIATGSSSYVEVVRGVHDVLLEERKAIAALGRSRMVA